MEGPPPPLFGAMLKTLVCASVDSPYPMIQPVYGGVSQFEDHAVYTIPLSKSSPGLSL